MNQDELKSKIETQLKTLRAAATQAQAIEWMKGAFLLMEESLKHLERAPSTARFGIIHVPETKVYCLPDSVLSPIYSKPPVWLHGQTTVYPPMPMLIKKPKAWTHKDTMKLVRAAASK